MNAKRSRRPADSNAEAGDTLPESSYGEMPRPLESEELRPKRPATLEAEFKETARTAGRAVQEQAAAFAADVGHELSRSVEEQKGRGAEALRAFAGAVMTASQELDSQSPQVARYVRDAAERVHSLAGNIEGRNINDLMRNATEFARSRPTMFFAGAMAAGFALSRFLKSSAQQDEVTSQAQEEGASEPDLQDSAKSGVDRHVNS